MNIRDDLQKYAALREAAEIEANSLCSDRLFAAVRTCPPLPFEALAELVEAVEQWEKYQDRYPWEPVAYQCLHEKYDAFLAAYKPAFDPRGLKRDDVFRAGNTGPYTVGIVSDWGVGFVHENGLIDVASHDHNSFWQHARLISRATPAEEEPLPVDIASLTMGDSFITSDGDDAVFYDIVACTVFFRWKDRLSGVWQPDCALLTDKRWRHCKLSSREAR